MSTRNIRRSASFWAQEAYVARAAFAERLAVWEAWEATSIAAQGVSRKQVLDLA
jgi:hypothetical protein